MSAEERDFLDEYRDEDTETSEADDPSEEEETGDDGTAETAETADKPEAKAEESEAPAATETPTEHQPVPYAAMKAEREKRQERERELADARRELEALRGSQNGQVPQPQQGTQIWEDPDGFVNQRIQHVAAGFRNQLLNMSEAMARDAYPDYDQIFEQVQDYCRSNPAAGQQILASPNPAMAAYKFGKKLAELKAMQNPDEYRQKMKAQLRAEIEAEARAKEDAKRKAAESVPPDLSASRNVDGKEPPVEDSFETLFPRN